VFSEFNGESVERTFVQTGYKTFHHLSGKQFKISGLR
jgi:hypothetical protein